MSPIVDQLFKAQPALLRQSANPAEAGALLNELRKAVPASILTHFLRLVESGRPGVAVVRGGVCSGCHIRVPASLRTALLQPNELSVCDQCGCFLLLADEEKSAARVPLAARRVAGERSRRRVVAV
jgi:hypothetical protein